MIDTISISEIEDKADNVYESVIVVAKRARQINDEQKQLLQREQDEYDEDYDALIEEEGEIIPEEGEYLKLPKPSALALGEFMEGKLEYFYRETEEEESKEEK
jgi:DNA-directed RNA polymerase omega subunit